MVPRVGLVSLIARLSAAKLALHVQSFLFANVAVSGIKIIVLGDLGRRNRQVASLPKHERLVSTLCLQRSSS